MFLEFVVVVYCYQEEEVDLLSEDITLIKKNALKLYSPIVYGQLIEFLGEK